VDWFLILHIAALLFWLGFLLYLPTVISPSTIPARAGPGATPDQAETARYLFISAATPSALVAIIAGTLVFLIGNITAAWLIVKLTLVVALVVNHIVLAMLIVRARAGRLQWLRQGCWLSQGVTMVIGLTILWMVLRKPVLTL